MLAEKKTTKKPSVVFGKTNTSVGFKGGVVRVTENEIWDAADPFVKDHPELFDATPPKVRSTTDPRHRPVERAVAAPGRKRPTT